MAEHFDIDLTAEEGACPMEDLVNDIALPDPIPGGMARCRAKHFMVTINNPAFPPQLFCSMVKFNITDVTFVMAQFERGEQGTAHIQAYVQFDKQKRFSSVLESFRSRLNVSPHLDACRGSAEQCIAYVSKEETRVLGPWQEGVPNLNLGIQGRRSDLDDAVDLIKNHESLRVVAREYPKQYLIYGKGMRALKHMLDEPQLQRCVIVSLLYGKTGTGKTHMAINDYGGPTDFYKKNNTEWWDGYEGEKKVILDEFDGSSMTITELLCVLDKWPHRINVKNGWADLNAEIIVICTNIHPKFWYMHCHEEQYLALSRRITEVRVFNGAQGESREVRHDKFFFGEGYLTLH